MPALADTGSQVTAISEELYKYLTLHGKLVELPVSNVDIFTAIGKKPTTVRKQIMYDLQIGDNVYPTFFLIIPKLSNPIILGNNWFLENNVVIDYQKAFISINGKIISDTNVKFDEFFRENENSDRISSFEYIQNVGIQSEILNIGMIASREPPKYMVNNYGCNGMFREDRSLIANQIDLSSLTANRSMVDETDTWVDSYNLEELFQLGECKYLGNQYTSEDNGKNNIFREKTIPQEIYDDKILENQWNIKPGESEIIEDKLMINLDAMTCLVQEDTNDVAHHREGIESIASELEGFDDFQREMFVHEMSRFEKLFTPKNDSAKTLDYRLKIKPHKSIIRKTYPVPLAFREKVDRAIAEMEKSRIIERTDSPYCSPLRIVVKSNGDVRVCLDARYINDIIEPDHEAPPLVNDLMQKFYGVSYMSSTDLAAGYWQIPLHEESRKYTAFLYDSKMYQFRRIPFGLKTAGSAFMRAVRCALGSNFDDFLTIYVDDFLVATPGSFENHLRILSSVFLALQEKNFTLKLEKSLFFRKKIKFLGFELSIDGIRPLNDKLDVIFNFAAPRNRKELQSFIGICTYYRQFTKKHANLLEPFRDILGEKMSWVWTSKHDQAFNVMKSAFAHCVKLFHYIPGVTYKLQTDASDLGISGVLYQTDQNGDQRIIALVSRCLNSAEVNYTVTEKELLAIVYSIIKLRTYLMGSKFEIITDHKGLVFLKSTPYLCARLIRWSLLIQQYDFEVKYCKGSDNVIADFFSRNPSGKFESPQSTTLSIDVLGANDVGIEYPETLSQSLKNLAVLQLQDVYISKIMDRIKDDNEVAFYVLYENILFRKDDYLGLWQVVIPMSLARELMACVHTKLGHPGVYKTTMYLRQYYYWKGMGKQIKNFVLTCDLCQRVKPVNLKMECQFNLVQSSGPRDLICVDFYGPLPRSVGGVEYIFVILDAFSKYVKLYAIKKENTDTILGKLCNSYVPEMGKPQRILSDHGSQFTSPKWGDALRRMGIDLVFSSIRHPKSNPVERIMRELGRLFRTLCADKHTRWAKHRGDIEFFLNVTTHSSTGFSPVELHFNVKPSDELLTYISFPQSQLLSRDAKILLARERIDKAHKCRLKQQKTKSKITLKEGDLVLLGVPKQSDALKKVTRKFFHLYYGPYRIIKDFQNNAFQLSQVDDESQIIGTYNQVNLKRYHLPPNDEAID